MTTVTLSSKFQIVIPKKIRDSVPLSSGMKFDVIPFGDRIELIPVHPINSLRGVLDGIDTNIVREKDRDL